MLENEEQGDHLNSCSINMKNAAVEESPSKIIFTMLMFVTRIKAAAEFFPTWG